MVLDGLLGLLMRIPLWTLPMPHGVFPRLSSFNLVLIRGIQHHHPLHVLLIGRGWEMLSVLGHDIHFRKISPLDRSLRRPLPVSGSSMRKRKLERSPPSAAPCAASHLVLGCRASLLSSSFCSSSSAPFNTCNHGVYNCRALQVPLLITTDSMIDSYPRESKYYQ